MNDDAAPPTPLPPASQPPYPAHPVAHTTAKPIVPDEERPADKADQRPLTAKRGVPYGRIALIGGIALAVGSAWALVSQPRPKAKPHKKRSPAKRPGARKKAKR